MKTVNYLDVTLDLTNGVYRPFHKPDNEINYIHKDSNHPPSIIKQIPLSIETRLSNLSANENIFNEATPHYEQALQRSGYKYKLKYNPNKVPENTATRNRKRKIIWFNPPYNSNLSTNIGKFFLQLILKHFPQEHKFNKIFNKNNLKVSYSCMPNINSTINSHNKKILKNNSEPENPKTCNCTKNNTCPLNKNCLASEIVYEATISSGLEHYEEKKYIGLCETTFKKRFANHNQSFTSEKHRSSTSLSKEYWKIKELNGQPNVTWKILRKSKSFRPESRNCQLCINEKYEIANYTGNNLLNTRTEIIAKCRHRRKYQLLYFQPNS